MISKINTRRRVYCAQNYGSAAKSKIFGRVRHSVAKSDIRTDLQSLHQQLIHLFAQPSLAKEHRYLRRLAIQVQQLHHSASLAYSHPETKRAAQQIRHFLSTPLGAPFVARTTLVQAILSLSEQAPHHSDLSELLSEMASYAPQFNLQLLRIFCLL